MAHDTVAGHVDAGAVAPRKRTTAADLDLAATWLEAYEGDTDDDADNLLALATVARYLRNQAERRSR